MKTKRENTCSKCDFFHEDFAECRKNCPTLGGFPSTEATEWCGEFQARGLPPQEQEGEQEGEQDRDVDGFSTKQEYNRWRNVL
jgi:hypothetical protein